MKHFRANRGLTFAVYGRRVPLTPGSGVHRAFGSGEPADSRRMALSGYGMRRSPRTGSSAKAKCPRFRDSRARAAWLPRSAPRRALSGSPSRRTSSPLLRSDWTVSRPVLLARSSRESAVRRPSGPGRQRPLHKRAPSARRCLGAADWEVGGAARTEQVRFSPRAGMPGRGSSRPGLPVVRVPAAVGDGCRSSRSRDLPPGRGAGTGAG